MGFSNLLYLVVLLFQPAFLSQTPAAHAQDVEAVALPASSSSECQVKAWVRAQDLSPGNIAHGDVRVTTIGECDIQSASLGLRFMERSAVKLSRENVEIPTPPSKEERGNFTRQSLNDILAVDSTGSAPMMASYNQSAWTEYEQAMRNRSLWIVKEQERIAFDVQQKLSVHSMDTQASFALLVPNTNYPPSPENGFYGDIYLDLLTKGDKHCTNADSEIMVEYYVEVLFGNGTAKHVHCGHTTFLPVSTRPSTVFSKVLTDVTLKERELRGESGNFTLNLAVWLPSDGYEAVVMQGSSLDAAAEISTSNVKIRGVVRGLRAMVISQQMLSWASSFSAKDVLSKHAIPQKQLAAKSQAAKFDPDYLTRMRTARGNQQCISAISVGSLPKPAAETLHIVIEEDVFPDFKMTYADVSSHLQVVGEFVPESLVLEESEGDDNGLDGWVPQDVRSWVQRSWSRSDGMIPLTGTIPIRVRSSQYHSTGEPVATHYLVEGARAPVFVDVATVQDLRALSSSERDVLAPISSPQYVDYAEDEVQLNRYRSLRPSVYVGATWQRKVVDRGGDPRIVSSQDGSLHKSPLIVQTP